MAEGARMNTSRTQFLKDQIKLYEEKRAEALYQQHYDNAIETYNQELQMEFSKE